MSDDKKSGLTLMAGSLGMIVTMAVHPVAGGSMKPEQAAHLMTFSGIVHSLAMVSALVLFLGACGLTRRVAAADRVAFAAVVTYGFACVAVMIAAAVSGFIVPDIMAHMLRDEAANTRQWQIVLSGIFQINQAFARILSVASALAIILWSVSALRNGGFGRGIALYGCIMSVLLIAVIAIGHLRFDVHGMGAVVLAESIWFIVVGYQLWSRPVSDVAAGPSQTPA